MVGGWRSVLDKTFDDMGIKLLLITMVRDPRCRL
jgi:hypothetical protein